MKHTDLDFEHVPSNDYSLIRTVCPTCNKEVSKTETAYMHSNGLGFTSFFHIGCYSKRDKDVYHGKKSS